MAQAQEIVICSEDGYSARKMQIRNERMVHDADVHLAVWDGTSGGTSNCVNYMIRFGAEVIRFDPSE
jgi:uncharacterized phage-like protein YoqJ